VSQGEVLLGGQPCGSEFIFKELELNPLKRNPLNSFHRMGSLFQIKMNWYHELGALRRGPVHPGRRRSRKSPLWRKNG
jgi:hypothetical protein